MKFLIVFALCFATALAISATEDVQIPKSDLEIIKIDGDKFS